MNCQDYIHENMKVLYLCIREFVLKDTMKYLNLSYIAPHSFP